MSETSTGELLDKMEPFSFEGWSSEEVLNAPINFAEKKAADCTTGADADEQHGFKERAAEGREAALWWRGLKHLPSAEGCTVECGAWLDASEHITVLLARSNVSDQPIQHLYHLALQIHEGLNALAANGNQEAGRWLLYSLFESVDNFNKLASHKPELFKEVAACKDGVPGIISPHTEKTEDNARLVEKLEVATKCVRLRKREKKMPRVFSTASNLWATRLYHFIVEAQIKLRMRGPRAVQAGESIPGWHAPALLLPPFSRATWKAWAGVAWEVVMEATGGMPERQAELLPIGASAARKKPTHKEGEAGERTQASNVRNKIKEGLNGAFKKMADAK